MISDCKYQVNVVCNINEWKTNFDKELDNLVLKNYDLLNNNYPNNLEKYHETWGKISTELYNKIKNSEDSCNKEKIDYLIDSISYYSNKIFPYELSEILNPNEKYIINKYGRLSISPSDLSLEEQAKIDRTTKEILKEIKEKRELDNKKLEKILKHYRL
jgi:hypothetical protein